MSYSIYGTPSGCGCGGQRAAWPGQTLFPFPALYPLRFVHVTLAGDGSAFSEFRSQYSVPYAYGLSIAQALGATNAVRFFRNGQIATVHGIPLTDDVDFQLTMNGQLIPPTLLSFPIQPNDQIGLALRRKPISAHQ